MANNPVKFVYIATGSSMPAYPDVDTIYFLEGAKELRVGSALIANVSTGDVDLETLNQILEAYTVKSIEITGTGDTIANVAFNNETGKVTVTKGNLPVLAKGAGTSPTTQTLEPSGYFEVVTDTSVSGHTITDSKTRFRLPKQLTNILISTSGTTITYTLVYSDGTTQDIAFAGLGSAAFASTSDFATADQGVLASNAMPQVGGVATDAQVQLRQDPVNALDAATKKYVDDSIAGAASNLNFLGQSTTEITEGGTESPTINGSLVPIVSLNPGDWVIYDGTQFIWDGFKWIAYGNSGKDKVPVERRVIAGEGLTGGGALATDVTLSHETKTSTGVVDTGSNDLTVVDGISYDKFGHVDSVHKKDITSQVNALVEPIALDLLDNYYTKTDTEAQIDSQIENSVATNTEFQEMMNEVFD